jgi:1,4-alpha-glucan branching enzyme
MLARCLADGFAYQGEPSPHDGGRKRGAPSSHLPPTAFVDFLQNHDQVGNRALGERLKLLAGERGIDALTAILLLSPHIPLLFMGEEWGESRPFLFFADYEGELADAVREGRREEFAKFSAFAGNGDSIPDPNALSTFEASKLDWQAAETPEGREHLRFVRSLLALRREHIVPLLDDGQAAAGRVLRAEGDVLAVDWQLAAARLELRANLGDGSREIPPVEGETLYRSDGAGTAASELPPWSVLVAVAR